MVDLLFVRFILVQMVFVQPVFVQPWIERKPNGWKQDWTKSFGPKPVGRKSVGRKLVARFLTAQIWETRRARTFEEKLKYAHVFKSRLIEIEMIKAIENRSDYEFDLIRQNFIRFLNYLTYVIWLPLLKNNTKFEQKY